jgi:predicted kinase
VGAVAPNLVVIYGAPFTGKSTLAWELARLLDSKTAVVSTDHLATGAIAVPDTDAAAELDMAHIQLRLLVANYLKNGYNTVVEGAFIFERNGQLLNHEAEIDQLIALMRHLTNTSVIIRLDAPESTLRERAASAGRPTGADAAIRIAAEYKDRYGVHSYRFNTSTASANDIATRLREDAGLT